MKKDLKDRWCDALESGEYKQGTGALRRRNGEYCCLGVLCDITDPNKWTPSPNEWDKDTWEDGFVGVLSRLHSENIGLTVMHHDQLISMNDANRSFKEIAAWIRENLSDV